MITYPMRTGRNFDEVLRVIDSLQLTAKHKVATPVNWKQGEDVIIVPSVNNEQAKEMFPSGWEEKKPYLRVVKQPGRGRTTERGDRQRGRPLPEPASPLSRGTRRQRRRGNDTPP